MRRFETSIKPLLDARSNYIAKLGRQPLFLSDWDTSLDEIVMPSQNPHVSTKDVHPYYYWTDEQNNKSSFIQYVHSSHGIKMNEEEIALATNGTASLFVTFMALKELNIKNVLILTPVYFTTLNIMDYFDFNVSLFQVPFPIVSINYEKLEAIIKKDHIEAIMLTNPLFGTGAELSSNTISRIAEYANQYDIWFIMDYIYGGMNWTTDNPSELIFNYPILSAISCAKKYVFIESISKRLFLNGIKFAFVFSTEKMMRRI